MKPSEANYDETRVRDYLLPDPLVANDGTRITSAQDWFERRRPELLRSFEREMFGITPSKPISVEVSVMSERSDAVSGLATRRELEVVLDGTHRMSVLVYLPNAATEPAPLFAVLNFLGNSAIEADPMIALPRGDIVDMTTFTYRPARDDDRGVSAGTGTWPLELILERGYALATIWAGDIAPDFPKGITRGVHALFADELAARDGEWGTIGAWGWGLSRAIDACLTLPEIDSTRVSVLGHSRLGKAALWAGANDDRIALVVANDSGCCGAAISRRNFGESIAHINEVFPHWFTGAFRKYSDNELELPFDQHELVALVAPRHVYIASATGDQWADPHGEFLGAVNADPVYRLLGARGLDSHEMPEPEHPIDGDIGYHLRTGPHDITRYDWVQYLDYADRHLR